MEVIYPNYSNLLESLYLNNNYTDVKTPQDPQKNYLNSMIHEIQKTLESYERSVRKTSEYEQKLRECKHSHNQSHDTNKWWNNDISELKNVNLSPTSHRASPNSSSSGVGKTESVSTTSLVCLKYQYEELSKRYETLMQAYNNQCKVISASDMKLAQCQQRVNLTRSQLEHAHKALITVGEKYLALKRKRNATKTHYERRIKHMKDILQEVIEATARELLQFDDKLSCMSSEKSGDAALLLYEIRKCNLLFLENIRLKTIIEQLLPGQVNWKKH